MSGYIKKPFYILSMEKIDLRLDNKIREKLDEKGLSVPKAAALINMSKVSLYNYVNGDTEIGILALNDLCELLDCEPSELYPNLFTNKGNKNKLKASVKDLVLSNKVEQQHIEHIFNILHQLEMIEVSSEDVLSRGIQSVETKTKKTTEKVNIENTSYKDVEISVETYLELNVEINEFSNFLEDLSKQTNKAYINKKLFNLKRFLYMEYVIKSDRTL